MKKKAVGSELVAYKKQKLLYIVRTSAGDDDLLFPNIKAVVEWMAVQNLFPKSIRADYDKIVRCIRSGKAYAVLVQDEWCSVSSIAVQGVFIHSKKRERSIEPSRHIHEFARKLDQNANYIGDMCLKCDYFSPEPAVIKKRIKAALKDRKSAMTDQQFFTSMELDIRKAVWVGQGVYRALYYPKFKEWYCYENVEFHCKFKTEDEAQDFLMSKESII